MADPTLHLPRILCFHGAGSNAAVFQSQCRALIPQLQPHFRLCFVDGPFICEAGPGILLVYEQSAPFRRWLRWRLGLPPLAKMDDSSQIPDEEVYKYIEKNIQDAMRRDDNKGATGEWVGLLGFSQGAKLCASLLFRQQVRTEKFGAENAGSNFRFAVLMNGPGPLVAFEKPESSNHDNVDDLQQEKQPQQQPILRIPTLHVHALEDSDLPYHRMLRNQFCGEQTAWLIEWNGDHRIPLALKDVSLVANRIVELARQTGVI
ncbi:citrinin biosynthesis oxidoreductase CtnB [Coccidioides immitis RS]|uniref:Citrinin biosynthesis oxydoreductase CtnB n=2 Tax=Coccidioides immitis TaxID=5501 RepID=J3K7S1_COCIM|nr:citrinin biosynthesis oxidoreductase CtnB [Coccidioides immitis RS]EAS30778.3 citrinin biosynthesis oxydoreductase CtnB [Coccidioides immitis RS]KMP03359.1 citrinin biosynthesis oxydoreductase CtnB [Coccidioides immitis RMSCC 2394]